MLKYSANNRTFYRLKSESSIWLGLEFLNRTFSTQEDDPIIEVDEITELLDGSSNDSFTKRNSNPPYL